MESINLLNTGNNVNNTATFAASMTSSSLTISDGATQSSNFNAASHLSFNEHLKNSIEPVKPSIDNKLSEDELATLADDLVLSIKEVVQKNADGNLSPNQQSDAINKLINELKLTDNNAKDIKSLISDIEGVDEKTLESALLSIKNILSEFKINAPEDNPTKVTTPEVSNGDSSVISVDKNEIETSDDINTETSEDINTEISSSVINAKTAVYDDAKNIQIKDSVEVSKIESLKKKEAQIKIDALDIDVVDNTQITNSHELSEIISFEETMVKLNAEKISANEFDIVNDESYEVENIKVEKSDVLNVETDKNTDLEVLLTDNSPLLNDIEMKISDIEFILDEGKLNPASNELLVDIKAVLEDLKQVVTDSNIDNEALLAQLDAIEKVLPSLSSEVSLETMKEKVIELVGKLPASQQQILMVGYSKDAKLTSEKAQVSPNELLSSLEKSHEILSDEVNKAPLINMTTVKLDATDKPPRPAAKFDTLTNDKISKFDTDIKNTTLEPVTDAQSGDAVDIDAMISQLESSFKGSGQAQALITDDTASITSRAEQQTIKELSNLQQTTTKTTEIVPPKLALNDNVMAAQQLKEHLIMMSRGGINQAVLQLDPEELGAMSVRIVMQNEQMNVQFQVQNPQAKEMLEQAMNKLKESLEEQGIALNQSDVEQQDQQRGKSQSAQDLMNEQLFKNIEEDDDSQVMTMTLHKQSSNGIDYYA